MDIKISDIKKIKTTLLDYLNIDVNNFAPFSFKRSLEAMLDNLEITNIDLFINKIETAQITSDDFFNLISVPETGMFRDGSTWRKIKTILKNEVPESTLKYKIWVPTSMGDEYYTLLIILHQENLIDKVDIVVTALSEKILEKIKEGNYNLKQLEVHSSNYKRYEGRKDFENYFEKNTNGGRFSKLIKNTSFKKIELLNQEMTGRFNLIIYRNKLLYLSGAMQDDILTKMHSRLHVNGKLVVGLGENIFNTANIKKLYTPVYQNEHIYKRI